MIKKLMALAAVVGVLTLAGPIAPASAEKPVERFKFVDPIQGPEPDLAAECGLDTVLLDGAIKVTVNLFEDGSARIHENLDLGLVNPDTGGFVRVKFARTIHDAPVQVIIEGGVVTEIFDTTFIGIPEMWMVSGVGVLARDAGTLSVRATLRFDEATGDFLGFEEEILHVGGPHDLFTAGPPWGEICEALGGVHAA